MSSVDQELLDILVCPETRQPVSLADGQTIASLNEKIRAGKFDITPEKLAIDDGIPVMLIEESIEL